MAVDDPRPSARSTPDPSAGRPDGFAPAAAPRPPRLSPWSAFAYRDFTILWAGGVTMMVAMQMRLFTSAQWLYETTGSEAQLGLLGAVQLLQMPVVIYGGALADSMNRKWLMSMPQVVSLIALAF
ncbi:MAG: hypothetical protein HQ548_04020, partial [Chloroflexi bacterium]|nr:hypothetical protein [Chloroflexota bacterium]